ncbi:MAG: MBOAT family protein [Roseburia sp.]|nr:MBOAT family protein [Roseburia sp.]
MVFSSVIFLFRFMPLFFLCYYAAPGRMRNIILLLGSLYFYAWGEPVYISLMFFSILVDYVHGRLLDSYRGRNAARLVLCSSVVMNLLLLLFFKYAPTGLPLPIGISFYTFQTMSYTIDVYRGEIKPQKNLLNFGVYVTMFPQLIAGPIVKYKQVADRLEKRRVNMRQISYGLGRFILGLSKKVLLANQLGELWEEVSAMEMVSSMEQMSVLTAWLGILAFALQIYFDFSGYSDMAIGLGACLGFRFPENFRYPYLACSITDFWRRWHITLGSWFREYVYIPLGGNRKGRRRQLLNLLLVFALTGVWHGAGVNFLIWGLWFALFLILEKVFLGELLKKLSPFVGWLYAFFVVITGWVFFALEGWGEMIAYLGAMFGWNAAGLYDRTGLYLGSQYLALFVIGLTAATPIWAKAVGRLRQGSSVASIALYRLGEKVVPATLLLLSIAYVVEASYNPFLYFRF